MALAWTSVLDEARTRAQDNGTTKGVSNANAITLANGIGRWLRSLEPVRTFIENATTTGLNPIGATTITATSTPTNWLKIHRLWNVGTSSTATVTGVLIEMLDSDRFFDELERNREANNGVLPSGSTGIKVNVRRPPTATGADQGKWIVYLNKYSTAGGYKIAAEVEYDWTEITGSGTEYPDLLPHTMSLFVTLLGYEIARLNNRDQAFLQALLAPYERDPMIVQYFERERVAKAARNSA